MESLDTLVKEYNDNINQIYLCINNIKKSQKGLSPDEYMKSCKKILMYESMISDLQESIYQMKEYIN